VCADTDEEADHLAKTVDLNLVRRNKGEYQPLASPDDAAKYPYTDAEKTAIAKNRARMSVGSPATVKAKLDALIASTKADEVMVTTMIHGHEARKRSYQLLAEAFQLKPL
jgi:alkanesulfonate monooxygenase SsuD/methylene tetrahydromethanopterin reductase-like flavin-dependent oxidoreductase (luciferase family)